MVTSEAVVLTLQRDGGMEGQRGKKEERSADKDFYVCQFALSFETLPTNKNRLPTQTMSRITLHKATFS